MKNWVVVVFIALPGLPKDVSRVLGPMKQETAIKLETCFDHARAMQLEEI